MEAELIHDRTQAAGPQLHLVDRPADQRGGGARVPSITCRAPGKPLPKRATRTPPRPGCGTTCAARACRPTNSCPPRSSCARRSNGWPRRSRTCAASRRSATSSRTSTGGSSQWRRIPLGPPVFLPLVDEEALVSRWRDAQADAAAAIPGTRARPARPSRRRPPGRRLCRLARWAARARHD